jgi:hypothetical protein
MEAGEVYYWSRRCADDGSLLGALLMGVVEADGHRGTAGELGHERRWRSAHLTSPTRRGRLQSAHLTSPTRRGGDGFIFGLVDGAEMASSAGSWPARR